MSNPAVIILDKVSKWRGKLNRFQIEDNIGESIHIHIDDIRFDFTISEFLKLNKMMEEALDSLELFNGHNLKSFDPVFLKDISRMIPYISNINIEEIEISKLKCITRFKLIGDIYWITLRKIEKIPAFKYLNGNKEEFLSYKQKNLIDKNNIERINRTLTSIKKNGYPFNDQYIVLFNKQNIVRDGQHRIAALAHLNGLNSKIKVMRIDLDGNFKTKIFKQNFKTLIIKPVYKLVKYFFRK